MALKLLKVSYIYCLHYFLKKSSQQEVKILISLPEWCICRIPEKQHTSLSKLLACRLFFYKRVLNFQMKHNNLMYESLLMKNKIYM